MIFLSYLIPGIANAHKYADAMGLTAHYTLSLDTKVGSSIGIRRR